MEGARGGPRTTQNRHLPGSSGTGLMANHRATLQAKCRKHLKSSRPKDLGTGPTPAQAHLPGSTLSAPEDRDIEVRAAASTGISLGHPHHQPLTLEDQLSKAAFPCAVWERPGVAPAPLRSANHGHLGPSHGFAGCRGLQDAPWEQMVSRWNRRHCLTNAGVSERSSGGSRRLRELKDRRACGRLSPPPPHGASLFNPRPCSSQPSAGFALIP